LSGLGLRQTNLEIIALDPETQPTLADFVADLAGDTEGLLNLVQIASLNHVAKHTLAAAFKEAGVDLAKEVAIARRLLEISPRAAALGQAQIEAASALLALG
jgi:hypothetical protein